MEPKKLTWERLANPAPAHAAGSGEATESDSMDSAEAAAFADGTTGVLSDVIAAAVRAPTPLMALVALRGAVRGMEAAIREQHANGNEMLRRANAVVVGLPDEALCGMVQVKRALQDKRIAPLSDEERGAFNDSARHAEQIVNLAHQLSSSAFEACVVLHIAHEVAKRVLHATSGARSCASDELLETIEYRATPQIIEVHVVPKPPDGAAS
jgi:hypothetical protein